MAPGPPPVPPEVLAAGALPVPHHRRPDFRAVRYRTLARLQEVCRTRNDVLLFTASGSAAFESAVVNLLSPGERVLAVMAGGVGGGWGALAPGFGGGGVVVLPSPGPPPAVFFGRSGPFPGWGETPGPWSSRPRYRASEQCRWR